MLLLLIASAAGCSFFLVARASAPHHRPNQTNNSLAAYRARGTRCWRSSDPSQAIPQAGWRRGGNKTMTAAAGEGSGAATSPAMWSGSISEPRLPPAIWAILMMMASLVLARPPTMTQYSSARVEHFLKARYQLLCSLCDTWSISISAGMRSTVWCLLSSVIFPTFSISTSPTLACTPRMYHG